MKPKSLYLILCVAGTLLPYSQFLPFLAEHGLDLRLFVEQLFSNRISGFFGWDVIISSLVLWTLVIIDGRRAGMKHFWIPIAANLAVGVSLGLPLFLYLRERRLQRSTDDDVSFDTKRLPAERDAVAPDGSHVRVLLKLRGGSMAHFELAPGQTSRAVTHRTVEEIWFFLRGRGEMWRQQNGQPETIVPVEPGTCLTLPLGTRFQFRSFGQEPLSVLGVTMPPWPGEGEAVPIPGRWQATV